MERLGQHFLKNKNKIKKIVDALELKNGDTVVEIGPGHGELTSLLAKDSQFSISNFQIIAIEKDKNLSKKLQNQFSFYENIKIIEGDALKILPKLTSSLANKLISYKIVGNIPYYITGRLFRVIGELKNKPEIIVLTIQKEVVGRIYAKPPQMNLLAASVQFWAAPKIIDFISKNEFRPRPKVDSAIIKLRIKNQELGIKENYYKLIKILFKQPRKTILNNLKKDFKVKNDELIRELSALNVNPNARPQNLSVDQLKKMAELLYN